MPIQKIMMKGEAYYRYGDSGKLYKDRKDAEKQAQAIHASGYREKSDNNSNMKKKGSDGKACWDGYRYGGTVNGRDICTKMKK